ncbi:ATP-binding protein [Actinoplanes sp. NPDC051859]|uniref:PAS domain-containing sensor histidine kinase n=1 Tax=Actinoplanes sp. NPDC051859 TaxID=3363909 RepID=UPI0037AA6367
MGRQTLQAVLDCLDTAVLGCDTAGRPVLFNQAARELFGPLLDGVPIELWLRELQVTDLHGRPLRTDDLSLLRARDGERVRGTEVILTVAGGTPRSFRVHGDPVDDDGTVAAVVALHETTDQRRTERFKDCELQLSELLSNPEPADTVTANAVDLIGAMLDWAAVEFWTLDPVGQVLRRGSCWARQGHRLPCELPDQLVEGQGLPGRAWRSCAPEWSKDLQADADGARQASDWGSLRGALAVPIPSGAATLGVLVCFSDHHEVPDDTRTAVMTGIAAHLGEFLERRRAEQLTAELDRTRDEYIALVGHELRTPLTSVQAYTEMMRSAPDLTPGEREQMLDVMQRNTDRLHTLIAKLLDVAGTRSGQIALHTDAVDLAALAQHAADHAGAAASGITVAVNSPSEAVIIGDQHRLRAVLDELLSNAVTWAPAHSTVGVSINADAHTTVLAVTNTGPRIPADEREHIFDLFSRTDHAREHGIPGAGLGLTFARAVVERHGGTLVVSEPDEAATTFTIRLPTRHPAA